MSTKNNSDEREKTSPDNGNEQQELENILEQLSESKKRTRPQSQEKETGDEIIKKPTGTEEEAENIEGLLNKITETPDQPTPQKQGFFRKILNFFKKSG